MATMMVLLLPTTVLLLLGQESFGFVPQSIPYTKTITTTTTKTTRTTSTTAGATITPKNTVRTHSSFGIPTRHQPSFQRRSFRTATAATADSSASTQSTGSSSGSGYDHECDVLVLGGGPTGRAVSALLAAGNDDRRVILADANHQKPFVPNYGVW